MLIQAIFFSTLTRAINPLISGRQEPQLVPALRRAPTSSAVAQPDWMASTMAASPTLKQAHTWRPTSRLPLGGRPASRPARVWVSRVSSANSPLSQSRGGSSGPGPMKMQLSSFPFVSRAAR